MTATVAPFRMPPIEDHLDEPDPAEDLWQARPVLAHVRQYARSRCVAPWATLGVVLARTVAATKPFVQLPPIIGSHASLNLFVGLVGPPGAGKDAAVKVARDAVTGLHGFPTVPLGSGEGLSHMFMRPTKDGLEQWNDAALVTIGEIDTLTALVRRQASTVTSQLRQAAMGEQLGFFYVDETRRMIVPEHRYRLCVVAGIQPKRAAVLLDDVDGGTPQRFLWLPATDPDIPDEPPASPTHMQWIPPPWHTIPGTRSDVGDRAEMPVCAQAWDTIRAAHRARVRGDGEALDGHALLTRLKTAAALAILDGRAGVRDDDWDLAGQIMSVSDATREAVSRDLAKEASHRNRQQANAEAERTIIVQERVEEETVKRAARAVTRRLAKAAGRWVTRNDLRRYLTSADRPHFDAAIDRLLAAGQIETDDVDRDQLGHGGTGRRYRQASGSTR